MIDSNLLPGPPRNGPPYPADLAPARIFEATPEGHPPQDEEHDALLTYWGILRRHMWILLLACTLGTIVKVLMTLPQPPIYQATTAIEIQGINDDFLNMRAINPTSTTSFDPSYDIQTQIREMQSRSLMARVIKKMSTVDRAALTEDTGRVSAWRRMLHVKDPQAPSIEDSVASVAAGGVTIKPALNSRIVEISCDSTNPKVAAQFANSVAEEYIQQTRESRWESTQKTSEWLTHQLQDLKVKLERSEDELQSYTASAGLMFVGNGGGGGVGEKTPEKENVSEEKLRQLQTEALKAQTDLVQKQSRYELIKGFSTESLAEAMDDQSLATSQARLSELRQQMAELDVSLMPENPKVKRLQAKIDSAEATLKRNRAEIIQRIGNDYQEAVNRTNLLNKAYEAQKLVVTDQAAKVVHYNLLKREADTNRQIHDAILQRVKESGIVSAMQASAIRIIDPAIPPEAPYKPNLTSNAMVGFVGGLFVGVLFVFVRERSNRNLQQPGDTPFYLNVPELGVIPAADNSKNSRGPKPSAHDSQGLIRPELDPVELATWNRKFSLLAEAFRTMLTSLLFSGRNGDQPQLIVLTSANPAEGKTTVAVNLAIALAEINRRVLLVDADMRRPRLQNIFELDAGPGLADLLRDKAPFDDLGTNKAICATAIPGMFVLRSGRNSGTVSNLLHSARLPELLQRLRSEFDAVVIDTPPVLQISDARVIARLADAVILIVRAGQTTRDAAMMVKKRFGEDGTRVWGTILNNWNPKHGAYGYKYRYYNGNGANYSQQG